MPDRFLERGGRWVLGQLALMLAVAVLGPSLGSDMWPKWTRLGAVFLLVVGGMTGIAGAAALKCNRTIFPKPKEGSRLIQAGVYKWIRHPLYTSLMLVSAGWGLLCCSWPALAATGVLTVFLNAKAIREESWLRQQFADYSDYERRVRRFLPGVY